MSEEIKITPKMREIIKLIQDGWGLVTTERTAQLSKEFTNIPIRLDVFWKLERAGLIDQIPPQWSFELTEKGKRLK